MNWLRTWHESAARGELAALRAKLRTERYDVMGPGLRAAIDQHAAAVRDILALTAGRPGPIQLAAYTRGIQDVAVDQGWRPEHTGVPDWITMRLLAVCELASSDGCSRTHGSPTS